MTPTSKKIFIGLSTFTVVLLVLFIFAARQPATVTQVSSSFAVAPVNHASFGLTFADLNILNDPVGKEQAYAGLALPDLILISDIDPDHFDVDTLAAVVAASTTIIAPEKVFTAMPAFLQDKTIAMANGDSHVIGELTIEVLPMYNLPAPDKEILHPQGRGNGYLLEAAGMRMYIAGDSEDTPEMRALQDIQVAFIPMNQPDTMDVAAAADAVLDFAPEIVYPYHYREATGFADVREFEQLVKMGNPAIEVRLLDWYTE